jgi:hypothetical protein
LKTLATTPFLAALLVLSVSSVAAASTFTVTSLSDSGTGSLRVAIAAANSAPGSNIVFTPNLNGTISLSATLPTILAAMTITGNGDSNTMISGNNLYRVFAVSAGSNTVTLSSLTITNGNDTKGDSGGGGLLVASGTVNLQNSDLLNCNSTTSGGGILMDYGTLNVAAVYCADCTASTTGSIIQNYATTTVTQATFYGNGSGSTATGIYNEGDLTVTNSDFGGDTCTNIANLNSATIDGVTFGENGSPTYGAVVHNFFGATIDIGDCTMYLNGAKAQGSTIYNDGTLTAESCTITDPFELGTHADIYNDSLGKSSFTNCIILPSGPVTSVIPADLSITYSDVYPVPYAGIGNISAKPNLATLGYYGGDSSTYALLPGSPCLGTGTATSLTADQRGVAIPPAGPFDIGSFQSEGFNVAITGGNNQSTPAGDQFHQPLTATITAVNPLEPVAGGTLAVTAPTTGPSATFEFTSLPVASASTYATANAIKGSYAATFNTGAGTASFMLTNR